MTDQIEISAEAEAPGSTRDALVAGGLSCFARAGYAGARLADITGEVGFTTGTFYRYFESKQALYTAVYAEYAEELQFSLNNAGSLEEQFEAFIVVGRQHAGAIRAATEVARPGTPEALARQRLRDACANLVSRYLPPLTSWRRIRALALVLVDILDQYVLTEGAGWIPATDPKVVARSLARLVDRGLYRPG
jgi:AcrR family transcriptional regulator